jgi:hypothetical protein
MKLIILVILLIILLTIKLYEKYNQYNYKKNKITSDYINKNAKNGDLIYFRHNKTNMFINIATYFTHIGIIFRDSETNNVKILEIYPRRKKINKNIKIYDFNERHNSYNGELYISFINKEISLKKIKKVFEHEIMNAKFDYHFVINYIKQYILQYISNYNNPTTCTNFVSNILQICEVINNSEQNKYPLAISFTKLKTINDYKYSDIKYISS